MTSSFQQKKLDPVYMFMSVDSTRYQEEIKSNTVLIAYESEFDSGYEH